MLCCASTTCFAWHWDGPDSFKLTDLGGKKVVVLHGTESEDGQYALGWTILPVGKKMPPVDWSAWDKNQPFKFLERFYGSYMSPGPPAYQIIGCVVDFRHKKILGLLPDGLGDNVHSSIEVSWGPMENGRRHAFVEDRGRHNELHVWFVAIDGMKMRHADIYPTLARSVVPVLRDKRPYDPDRYEAWFPINPEGSKVAFHAHSADVPLDAVNRNDDTKIKGRVLVRLPEGIVGKARSEDQRHNPFVSNPGLALADSKLNLIYADLLRTLKPGARAALEKEEREWIRQRDGDAKEMLEDPTIPEVTPLLEATRKRIAELKARLDAARHH